MSYRVTFLQSARREFLALPRIEQTRIGGKIDALAANPRPQGATKLRGHSSLFRIRVGEYRIIYAVEDSLRIVEIAKIGHRRDVYRRY